MIGLEPLIKVGPILAVLVAGGACYGKITAQIDNLQTVQATQYQQIIDQLNRLDDKLDTKADKK